MRTHRSTFSPLSSLRRPGLSAVGRPAGLRPHSRPTAGRGLAAIGSPVSTPGYRPVAGYRSVSPAGA